MVAVTNYVTLRADVADVVNHDDLSVDVTAFEGQTLDSLIKRSVTKATFRIQRDLVARGGHKNMETVDNSLTTTGGTETLTLPTDFAGHRAFALTTNPYNVLDFVDPTTLWQQYPNTTTAPPEKFTIIGNNTAYLRPIPDGTYTSRLVYYQQLDALSADTDTNWVLTSHWDIYEAATMMELCIALENDMRLQFWQGKYRQMFNDLMGDDRNVRWAAVPTKPNLDVAIA